MYCRMRRNSSKLLGSLKAATAKRANRLLQRILIEQAVHGDESFSGGHIEGRKPAMCRKTVLPAEGDEQALADDFEMWEPTPSYYHILVVWRAF
jgi:hypothetical protein